MNTTFKAEINIAVKISKKYEQTVEFYRNILKFKVEKKPISNPTVSRTHKVNLQQNKK